MSGVPIVPGAIAHTRIPSGARSRAIGSVMPRIAPFAAEYAIWPVCPSMPAIDDVFTMTPRWPCSSGVVLRHRRRREPADVEGADRVHRHRGDERRPCRAAFRRGRRCGRRRSRRPRRSPRPRGAERPRGLDRGGDVVVVRDVAFHRARVRAELRGECSRALAVAVEDRDARCRARRAAARWRLRARLHRR